MNTSDLSLALNHLFPQGGVNVYQDGHFDVPSGEAVPSKARIIEALFEIKKADALEQVKQAHARALSNLSGNATDQERDTWVSKHAWAQAYIEGDTSVADFLTGMMRDDEIAAAGDEAALFMAQKIMTKARTMQALITTAEKLKREAEAAILAAASLADLEATQAALADKQTKAMAAFLAR